MEPLNSRQRPCCGGPRDLVVHGLCPRCLARCLVHPESKSESVDRFQGLGELGDYELIEEIARGGMGIVFRARQRGLVRDGAVKLMRDGFLADANAIRRFKAEAASAARLDHPNIVTVHEVGESNGLHFIAMRLVRGSNLAEVTQEGPLPPRRAAELVARIAEVIQHAHARGVLHRDLKPRMS